MIVLISKANGNRKFSSSTVWLDSCCRVSRSNYLKNSKKDCDGFFLAYLIRDQIHADATFPRLENIVWFENIS